MFIFHTHYYWIFILWKTTIILIMMYAVRTWVLFYSWCSICWWKKWKVKMCWTTLSHSSLNLTLMTLFTTTSMCRRKTTPTTNLTHSNSLIRSIFSNWFAYLCSFLHLLCLEPKTRFRECDREVAIGWAADFILVVLFLLWL